MRQGQHTSEGGNVLLIVIAAVGLFAALSLAINQSLQDGTGDRETAGVSATAIIQYMAAMTTAIDNLKQYNGCTNGEISFQRDWNDSGSVTDVAADAYNATSPTSPNRCHIFDREGAGFEYKSFGSNDVVLTGDHHFDGFGTAAADLALGMNSGISREMCQQANNSLDINGMPSDSDGESGFSNFLGVFLSPPTTIGNGTTPSLTGVRTACYQSGSEYIIYSVLYAR